MVGQETGNDRDAGDIRSATGREGERHVRETTSHSVPLGRKEHGAGQEQKEKCSFQYLGSLDPMLTLKGKRFKGAAQGICVTAVP